jgi:hypothetical protein
MLPVAHVGHYLWVLYLIPILIVVGAIVRNAIAQRRLVRGETGESSTAGGGEFTKPD